MSRRDEVLVTTDWVADHAGDPAVRLVEVDEDTAAYAAGHIRGAVAWHWRDDLHDPRAPRLPRPGGSWARCSALGGGPATPRSCSTAATTTGSPPTPTGCCATGLDRVRLMDGGRKKWELEGAAAGRGPAAAPADPGPLGPEPPRAARLPRRRPGRARRAGHAGRRAQPGRVHGRDARPRRTCPRSRPSVPGHIPGAANVPWARAAREDGAFQPDDELRALYRGAGVDPTRTSSPTAASASAPATPGSCCTSCWATSGCATTTAPGPSTAAWSACRSSATGRPPREPRRRAPAAGDPAASCASTRRHGEAELGRVPAQVLGLDVQLALQQQVVHLPEAALRARGLRRLGGGTALGWTSSGRWW